MHRLIEYVCDEMSDLERKAEKDGKLSMAEMQYLDTLAHTKKNLLKAEEMSDDGYSGRYPDYGRSYARKRDSMGRYSRRGYAMDDGMIEELHELRDKAPDEQTRKEFDRFIRKVESM